LSAGLVLSASLFASGARVGPAADQGLIHLVLRTRVEAFKGSGDWEEVYFKRDLPVRQTAVVICDMWDQHWCAGASRRVELLARKMAPVVDAVRAHNILVIHAPSETMNFYKDSPQRHRALAAPVADPPSALNLSSPPLPIDDSDGGCDTPGDYEHPVWTRENSILRVGPDDAISDDGKEIYNLLQERGIKNLLVMGVHANMCILNRSFAIKQMTKWGIRCVLVRDLTDSMYNPAKPPHVAHEQGTELIVQYIEKYWCPSTLSQDIVVALGPP